SYCDIRPATGRAAGRSAGITHRGGVTMPTTTTLNGQILGEAEHATRALLDRLLARTGTAFHEWVALNFLAINGGAMPRSQLTQAMAGGLKIDESVAQATVSGVATNGLVASRSDDFVALTDDGIARHR